MPILGSVVGLVTFVIFIIVLIKQFQVGGALHGIIGILTCTIWTFIWGWINAGRLNIQGLMIVWTLLWLGNIILSVAFGTFKALIGH